MSLLGFPETFRFAVFNGMNSSISDAPIGLPTVTGRRVRFDTNGALSYEAAAFSFFGPGATTSLAANGYLTGTTWSNTASAWLGGDFNLSAFASGNLSGTVALYLEASPDGGTTWPSPVSGNGAGGGMLVATIDFASTTSAATASTTRIVNFTV